MDFYEIEDLIGAVRDSLTDTNELSLEKFGKKGYHSIFPLWVLRNLNNIALCQIAITHKIYGPNAVFSPFADAGAQAIGEAMRCIQRGEANIVCAGGSSFKINLTFFARFNRLGLLSDQ